MYNGIGLTTPRGSGTNGHVQRNVAFVRPGKKDNINYRTEDDLAKLDAQSNRQPNQGILDHERKRKIEVKCAELEEVLESQGLSQDEVRAKVELYRSKLMNQGTIDLPKDEYGRLLVRETHHIAQAQQEKNAKLREAFGISQYFVEGTSFDQDRKAKEDLAKSEAVQKDLAEKEQAKEMERTNRKRYALVRTPSPEKEGKRNGKNGGDREEGEHDEDDEDGVDNDATKEGGRLASKGAAGVSRGKEEKKKKKKKARDASSSPERKKDKKKKSKKNKKERSKKKHSKKSHREEDSDSSDSESDSDSNDSDASSDSERDSGSKRKKKTSKKDKKKKSSKKKKTKSSSPSRNKSPAVTQKKVSVDDEKQRDKRHDNYHTVGPKNADGNKRSDGRDGRNDRSNSRDRGNHRVRETSRERTNFNRGGPLRGDRQDERRFGGNRVGGEYYDRNRDRDREHEGSRTVKEQERRSRSRNRRRERSVERDRKEKSRSRSGSRNRRTNRSPARGRSVENLARDKNRRERTPQHVKKSDRSQERDFGREKDLERTRERDRERDIERDREHDTGRERERKQKGDDSDRNRQRERNRDRDRDQERDRNRNRSQSLDKKDERTPSRRRQRRDDSPALKERSTSPQSSSKKKSTAPGTESNIYKKSPTAKKNSPDRPRVYESPVRPSKSSSQAHSSTVAQVADKYGEEASSDLSYSPARRDPERYRDILHRKKSSSVEKEDRDAVRRSKDNSKLPASKSPRKLDSSESPVADRRGRKRAEEASGKTHVSKTHGRASASPSSTNVARTNTQKQQASRDRSRSRSHSRSYAEKRRSTSPRRKDSTRRSSPDPKKRRDQAGPASNSHQSQNASGKSTSTSGDATLKQQHSPSSKNAVVRSRSPEVKKRRQERDPHSRKESPPHKASKPVQSEHNTEARRTEARSPERSDSRKSRWKKTPSASAGPLSSAASMGSSTATVVQQPVVKLHSPESQGVSGSDVEDREQEHNDGQRDRDNLDAFLPTYDENREQEKDMSLLKALKHDLAAKAKQSLEKKKSVSEGASTATLGDSSTTEVRVGENRERELHILQIKQQQPAPALPTNKAEPSKTPSASAVSSALTGPAEKQISSARPSDTTSAPASRESVTNSSAQMKKDIHEILSTVGACTVADGSEVAASLAKTTILHAVDSILKEKISGATKDKSQASGGKTRASTRSSRSRSRSHSRSHKSRSYSSSSSESGSSRSHSRSSSSHSHSSTEGGSSRSRSRSSSHSSPSTVRSRTGSRSPSIPRRAGSPSFLDRRRITSARKRPIPYRRPTPSSPSSASSYHSRGSRSRSRSRSKT